MTEQERIDYLANRIRGFKIAISGGADLSGGFGALPTEGVTIEHLEKSFSEFRLAGNNGLQAHGNIKQGYVLTAG